MNPLLKMAFLNLWRNRLRSWIAVMAVASGITAIVFLWGFHEGTLEDMRKNAIETFAGHGQITHQDFDIHNPSWKTIRDSKRLESYLNQSPLIETFSPRILARALVGTDESSRGALIMGIDFAKEKEMTRLDQKITEGTYWTGESDQIILGDRLATRIHAEVGDEIVVMARDRYGVASGQLVKVVGLFHIGSRQMDERFAYIHLESARELLGMEDSYSSVLVRFNRLGDIEPFSTDSKGTIDSIQARFVSWDKIAPMIKQWTSYGEALSSTIMFAVIAVIAIGLMNATLMSVMDRTKEMGVLLAMGMSPRTMISLVMLETFFLMSIGGLLGLVVGGSLVQTFGFYGVSLESLASALETNFMSPVVYTRWSGHHILVSIAILFIMTPLAAWYPAQRAAQLRPIEAIYHS